MHDRDRANHPTNHHRGAQSRRWPSGRRSTQRFGRTVAAKARELRLFQPEWEALGAKGRKKWLLKFQDWVYPHITDVVQSESGKPGVEAAMEAPMSADALHYWARNAEAFLADSHPKAHNLLTRTKRLTTVHRPYPLVGVITPWNFPFVMPAWTCCPCSPPGPLCC